MAERLDAFCVRESNGKSYFTKIGAAFPNKDGKGWSILLDAMPAPTDGQFKIMLREPLPKDGARSSGGGGSGDTGNRQQKGYGADLDDDVPFVRCDLSHEHRAS
jgi:hypothetical protein